MYKRSNVAPDEVIIAVTCSTGLFSLYMGSLASIVNSTIILAGNLNKVHISCQTETLKTGGSKICFRKDAAF